MCGIAGLIRDGAAEAGDASAPVAAMVAAMHHRGPDDRGVYRGDGVALGATRLAILDLSAAGHQPMASLDRRHVIAFNGEIYNFRELRRTLEQRGHKFRSGSDTEVLLAAWIEHGPACVHHLRGMFAFAVWDAAERRLFAARDHTGMKPLLYAVKGRQLIFASELKALLASGLVDAELAPEAVRQCLTLGYVLPPRTMLAGVQALAPGDSLTWHDGRVERATWWDLPARPVAAVRSYAEATALVRERVVASMREQMVADVPIGLFLSGGLDSSVMLATMAAVGGAPIECFTIGFDRASGLADERDPAGRTAAHFGARHHAIAVSGREIAADFPAFVAGLDQPSIDGLNSYWISRLARRHVTVALSGLGGDELFGGYPWQRDLAGRAARTDHLRAALAGGAARLTASWPSSRVHGWARRTWESRDLLGAYAERQLVLAPERATALLHPELRALCGPPGRPADQLSGSDDPGLSDPLQRIARLDLKTFMAARLLRDVDAAGMAHSLEVRYPLLDHRLVEDAFALPAAYKADPARHHASPTYAAGTVKRVLYDAFAADLPRDLGGRRRLGFEMPFAGWLRTDLHPRAEAAALASRSGCFEPAALARLWHDWRRGRAYWKAIWMVLVVELWSEQILHRAAPAPRAAQELAGDLLARVSS